GGRQLVNGCRVAGASHRPRGTHPNERHAMTENLAEDLDALARDLDADHVFHSWSAQAQRSTLVVASGRGSRVWDHAGREYLDFSSQLVNVNIGHQHPAVVQAIREQAELLTTVAPSTVNLARGEAAKRIVSH